MPLYFDKLTDQSRSPVNRVTKKRKKISLDLLSMSLVLLLINLGLNIAIFLLCLFVVFRMPIARFL